MTKESPGRNFNGMTLRITEHQPCVYTDYHTSTLTKCTTLKKSDCLTRWTCEDRSAEYFMYKGKSASKYLSTVYNWIILPPESINKGSDKRKNNISESGVCRYSWGTFQEVPSEWYYSCVLELQHWMIWQEGDDVRNLINRKIAGWVLYPVGFLCVATEKCHLYQLYFIDST